MATEIAKYKKQLSGWEANIRPLLPPQLDWSEVSAIAINAAQRNPKLLDCTPASLYRSLTEAARLGLKCDGVLGEAALVPFNNWKQKTMEAQLIPGYQGLKKLAYQAGITRIEAHCVYEGEEFDEQSGTDPHLHHKPDYKRRGDDDKIVAAYAVAWLPDGSRQHRTVGVHELHQLRARFGMKRDFKTKEMVPAPGPWWDEFPAMCEKTAIRRLCKHLPRQTVDMEKLGRAARLDELADAEIPQSDVIDVPFSELPPDLQEQPEDKPNQSSRMADEMKAKKGKQTSNPTTEPENQGKAKAPDTDALQEKVKALMKSAYEKGVDLDAIEADFCQEHGLIKWSMADDAQLQDLIERLEATGK